jgi:hypothetical protein
MSNSYDESSTVTNLYRLFNYVFELMLPVGESTYRLKKISSYRTNNDTQTYTFAYAFKVTKLRPTHTLSSQNNPHGRVREKNLPEAIQLVLNYRAWA